MRATKTYMSKFLNSASLIAIMLFGTCVSDEKPEISHGPLLGAVSENSVAIWIRTTIPGDVTFNVYEIENQTHRWTRDISMLTDTDNTCIVRFNELDPDTRYRYEVVAGNDKYENTFTTTGPSLKNKTIRIVYGYGYMPGEGIMPEGTSIFMNMKSRNPDAVLFLGDFPYTAVGSREQIHDGNKELREIIGFTDLTASYPTYGIYDDHDFGPNDCDGQHENADEALTAFKEYWPNPSYGLENDKGIYCSFVIGDVEFFLLDGRYPSRQFEVNPTMLGKIQYDWLCNSLSSSSARFKVLVSGTPFARIKDDCWAGKYYIDERDRLFKFINDNHIDGVIGISGDIHRCDIFKIPIGENNFFYDFTAGSLSRNHRSAPEPKPDEMIYSYGDPEKNMYAEIDFYPASDQDTALVFRAFSGKTGLVYEHILSQDDLLID